MSDEEIRDALARIDEDEATEVSQWEAEFLDSILYKYTGRLSVNQREAAIRIIKKHER